MAAKQTSKPVLQTGSELTIPRRRVAMLLAALLLLLVLVSTRTIWLQSVKNRTLTQYATNQQQNTQTLPAVRGAILDRNGQSLAIGEEAVTFVGDPRLIKRPAETANRVADVLGLSRSDRETLVARLESATGGFVYIARQVPRDRALLVQNAKIKGVSWYGEERRMYPSGTVAGQLIGGVNIDGLGTDGIEYLYNRSLTGTPGQQVSVRDPAGVPIDVRKLVRERDGKPVQLTIDSTIQGYAERILAQTVKTYQAESATAIVMDPRTGEIYAIAGVPTVNPSKWSTATGSQKKLRAVTDSYEPGSTFKVVAISGALEDGKVEPNTEFMVPPEMRFCEDDDTCLVHDAHERKGTEVMSTRTILVKSSNLGTIKVAQRLGQRRFDEWITKFGFGKPTGIDFPGEQMGIRTPFEKWSDVSIGNIPIGQGINVTPIQLASAYATIANDGVRVQPHLLKRVGTENAQSFPRKRILSSKTSREMRSMFGAVVQDEFGTGKEASIEGYKVGGKTGTANVAGPNGYVKGKYIASFVGFVPAQNPRLVTLVVVNEPALGEYGGTVAAPAFEKITQFALTLLAIPPDGIT